MGPNDNLPYSLFQDHITGLWGTKDKEGNIQDKPIYLRSEVPGHENTFGSKDGLTVVEFNPETGFDLIAWCSEPWYSDAWCLTYYPKEYENILWYNINNHREFTSDDCNFLSTIEEKIPLTAEQAQIFHLLKLLFQWEETDNIAEEADLEKQILNEEAAKVTYEERLQTILPLMKEPELTPDEKSTLYYGLFILNYRLTYLR